MLDTRQIVLGNAACPCAWSPVSTANVLRLTLALAPTAMVVPLVIYHVPMVDGEETARTNVLV